MVRSIIVNPAADPHAYEPTVGDAKAVAAANLVIFNGAGYDAWMQKLLAANAVPTGQELDAGSVVGVSPGRNPHIWYNPSDVRRVAARISADFIRLQPVDKALFTRLHRRFITRDLAAYFHDIAGIRDRYASVRVGATESIFVYLARRLHLRLTTPPGFMKAVAEGIEPTAQELLTFNHQIESRSIKVLVFNRQNVTPGVRVLVNLARSRRIPVVPITETLDPASASFQGWQTRQLALLAAALHRATGR